MEKCRRDFLWNKLLIGDLMDEDLKRKKRSDTEDSKDVRKKIRALSQEISRSSK